MIISITPRFNIFHLLLENIFLTFCLLIFSYSLIAQDTRTHNFNDGNFGVYEVNKTDQESRVNLKNNSIETHWQQSLYNGTNSGRKAQFRPIDDIIFTQHIWMGLKLKIHSDYMSENTNTNAGLMQIWGYNGASGAANHMCMLKFDGRNGGALVWQHRFNSVANKTHYLVEPNFPRNKFVDIIVHVQLKTRDTGIVQVWVDGELKINKINQTIGWGDMDETGMINGTYCFGTSLGQYNFFENAGYDDAYDGPDHWFDGHMPGETRTVTYDNVSLYNGANGYNVVDPSSNSNFTPDPSKTYYIDSPIHNLRLAANGTDEAPYTTSTNTTGPNVEWKFVANNNGYWHLQRASGGTKPRLRTNNTTYADMQEESFSGTYTYYNFTEGSSDNTYFLTLPNGPTNYKRLQIDSDGNVKMVPSTYNGSWESFQITEAENTSNTVHITKRNATGFAIDAPGSSPSNGDNVYLWSENENNKNQRWVEIDRGNGYYSYQKEGTNYCIDGNSGGANRQNVHLWECNENNYNQHWQKIDVGGGAFKLVKRNTPDYALNGGSNGTNSQNIDLYDSSSTSQNLHWFITPIGTEAKFTEEVTTLNQPVIYPNPVKNTTTIKGALNATISIYDLTGNLLLNKQVKTESEELNLNELNKGIYYAKILNSSSISVIKIIKE